MPAERQVDILVVEDDGQMSELLTTFLSEVGHHAVAASTGSEALLLYPRLRPAVVILDMRLPDMEGLDVLERLKQIDPGARVIILSSYSATHTVAEARRLGAETYLTKPTPLPELQIQIETLLKPQIVASDTPEELDGVIGRSRAMQDVFAMVRRVAGSQATVLILGESGTGKEVIARAIHLLSGVNDGPFVTLDCTNIPPNLMATELFGHEPGAFTDARASRKGLIEVADGGTLFLDEIGLMPIDLQAQLLTILESRRFRRVGGTQEIDVSVRFLAATNADLEQLVREGRFREDLFYRLNVVPMSMPSLREREGDIILLAEHYLELCSSLHGTAPKRLDDGARERLRHAALPGNVRELKNLMERAVLMTDSNVIRADDLNLGPSQAPRDEPSLLIDGTEHFSVRFPAQGLPLNTIEREVIRAALAHADGNITHAAALLHVSRDTLRYRMNKHGLQADPPSPS